jgi:two-component system, cell cycle sensor histidine kinase and response regulator CckA
MKEKITITLFPIYREYFLAIKTFLENQGHNITVIEEDKISDTNNSDLSIVFLNEITFDTIAFLENNLKKAPIILSYKHCPQEIPIDSFLQNFTFHQKDDLKTLPILIENAILKNRLTQNLNRNENSISPLLSLLENILNKSINKQHIEEYIVKILSMISEYAGANEYQLFVLPKFVNFNAVLYKKFVEKYDITNLNDYYSEVDKDSLIKELEKNQELIMFKKNGNVKTDITNDKKNKHYYSLIVVPVFINNALYGCIIFNFHKAVENINKLRQEIFFISKYFSFHLQYKIIYNQYENSINQFRRLINDAINGIYQSTENGKIIYANPAFMKIVGFDSLEELKEIDLFTDLYTSKSDRQIFIEKIKKEKTVHNYESILKKKSGKIINIIENSRIVDNPDGSVLFEGIIQDITHQIDLKEKLKYQTSFSEQIVETAPFLIIAINENKDVIIWNSLAESITGYDRNELFNDKGILNKIFTNNKSFESHLSSILQKDDLDEDSKYNDFELLTKNGEKRVIRLNWTLNEYLSNDKKSILGFGLDITETKKLEEQLFESQKMESIGTLAAGMAYDFNKILNELNVYSSSLKSNLNLESKEITFVNRIEDTLQKASTFTSKLIGLSRTEKKQKLEIDVNDSINYVIEILEHTVHDRIELEKEVCNNPIIEGDLSQIHQVFLNIALNANESIKNKGKITFTTEIVMTASDEQLNTLNPPEKNYVKTTIADSGKGIAPELLQRIFDPFFTTKSSGKSAGLGLSVAYNIVKNHRGYLFVDSKLEKGSNFYIYFPYVGISSKGLLQERVDDKSEKEKVQLKAKNNFQILVVDDEVIIRDLLNDVLEEQNYEVILAKDGLEGLELYKKYEKTINIVILDIIMPGMTGKEVFEKIREINSKAKIIITSGYSKQKVTDSLIANGANGFLPKPFNIDKLLGIIKALIEEF